MKKTSDYACLNVQKRIDEQIFQFTYYRHNGLFAEQTFSNLRLPQGATSGINRNALAVCVKVRKIKFEKFKGWSTKAHTQKGKNKL